MLYSNIYFNPKLTGENFERYFESLTGKVRGSIFLANEEQSEMKITELEMS